MSLYPTDFTGLSPEEQVVVDYLEAQGGGEWLKPLSRYFRMETGFKGRSTLNNVLRRLYQKDIVIRRKSYGKETYVHLVKEDSTIEVHDMQVRDYAVLFQEFKNMYDEPQMTNETRVIFMIKFATTLALARLESKVIANHMNRENKASELTLSANLEELYQDMSNFLVAKCDSDPNLLKLFLRQMPPIVGPTLSDMHAFIEALKAGSPPAAPVQGSKSSKSKNPKN